MAWKDKLSKRSIEQNWAQNLSCCEQRLAMDVTFSFLSNFKVSLCAILTINWKDSLTNQLEHSYGIPKERCMKVGKASNCFLVCYRELRISWGKCQTKWYNLRHIRKFPLGRQMKRKNIVFENWKKYLLSAANQ